jgi:hypothetical protein
MRALLVYHDGVVTSNQHFFLSMCIEGCAFASRGPKGGGVGGQATAAAAAAAAADGTCKKKHQPLQNHATPVQFGPFHKKLLIKQLVCHRREQGPQKREQRPPNQKNRVGGGPWEKTMAVGKNKRIRLV